MDILTAPPGVSFWQEGSSGDGDGGGGWGAAAGMSLKMIKNPEKKIKVCLAS